MEFTDSDELRRDILANQYLPKHLRERAKTGDSVYCRAEDADNLLEVDRLAGQRAHPLLYGGRQRFHAGGRARGDRPKHRPVDPRPYGRVKEAETKNSAGHLHSDSSLKST